MMRILLTILFSVALSPAQELSPTAARKLIDQFLDARFQPEPGDAEALWSALQEGGYDLAGVEALLRGPRASYPALEVEPGKITKDLPLVCDHVDLETTYHLFVPSGYDARKPHSLVLVGHGGNGSMARARASRTALVYLRHWEAAAEKHQMIAVAPCTPRGWGSYGNSILFSAISKLSRQFNIDPDRIYATGQSMGGHMSWRCAIAFPDRFGAVGPQSGGYDYVAKNQIQILFNTPGYATHGKSEPYGIADDNRTMKAWFAKNGYPWTIVEKDGGHEIYRDEIDKQFTFFKAHPRNLYREELYVRVGGSMRYDREEKFREGWDSDHTWNKERPIVRDTVHWLRMTPHEEPKTIQTAWAQRKGQRIQLITQNMPHVRVLLHSHMVDLSQPVTIEVNGHETTVTPKVDPVAMLRRVRATDDRGRIFHAAVDLDIESSAQEVPLPGAR